MVNLPNIKIIGLTGMSGAGKSTMCGVFRQRGFAVIDCDNIAHEVAGDRDFLNELQSRFPERVLNSDGSLNRSVTAKAIFTDDGKRKLYNQIIFPYIVYKVIREIQAADGDVLLDAPTLFESGLDMICTETVGIIAEKDVCAERILRRDGITREQALERLSVQHDTEFFKERCGYIIDNNGGFSDFTERAEKVTDKMKGTI